MSHVKLILCQRLLRKKGTLHFYALDLGKPMRPSIEGNLSIMVETVSKITCSSNSTSAPDYYFKLVTLTYTWFVNNTEIEGETNQTLSLKVTKGLMYNSYSCAATEEDLVSDQSNTVQISFKLCLV